MKFNHSTTIYYCFFCYNNNLLFKHLAHSELVLYKIEETITRQYIHAILKLAYPYCKGSPSLTPKMLSMSSKTLFKKKNPTPIFLKDSLFGNKKVKNKNLLFCWGLDSGQ